MFGFAPSEFAVIAAVALIALGPKDLPVAVRWMTGALKKARGMAAEFQTHVDEMVREANLDEVRKQINEIRNFDVKAMVEETVDPDHSLRDTFEGNPLEPVPAASDGATIAASGEASGDLAIAQLDRPDGAAEAPAIVVAADPPPPAFIPPALLATAAEASTELDAPAFIPPAVARRHAARPAP